MLRYFCLCSFELLCRIGRRCLAAHAIGRTAKRLAVLRHRCGSKVQNCVSLRQAYAKLTFDDQGGVRKAQLNKTVGKTPLASAARTPRSFACNLYRVNGRHHVYRMCLHLRGRCVWQLTRVEAPRRVRRCSAKGLVIFV